jgi:hypothetical protein
MNVAFRVFINGKRELEEHLQVSEHKLEALLPELAERHAAMIGDRNHMIEIEFLDEPDPNERFFRFGTDPTGMAIPIAFRLSDTIH